MNHPLGTVADHIGQHWIWLHCRECGHALKHDPADLAARFGAALSCRSLVARARCARCGARETTMTIQPPSRPDRADAPRERTQF